MDTPPLHEVVMTLTPLQPLAPGEKERVIAAADRYSSFLNLPVTWA